MIRRLPPFAALRAFEAAARLCSFKEAAQELALTPSAISHQIKALEEHLGVRLFYRQHNTVLLTEIGQNYLLALRDAFTRLDAATAQLQQQVSHGRLTIGLFPTLAATWLIPRLSSFHEAYPELDVRLITSLEPLDFNNADIDLAIRYASNACPDLLCDFLFEEELFPVCSPNYKKTVSEPLNHTVDLTEHTLIYCPGHPEEWPQWFNAAGIANPPSGRRIDLDSRTLVLRAAADGLGVAMGRRPFINDDLASGRLIAPFQPHLKSGLSYYLVCPQHTAKQPKIACFRQWLLEARQQ